MPGVRSNDWGHITRERIESLLADNPSFGGVGYLIWTKIEHACLARTDLKDLLTEDLSARSDLDACGMQVRDAQARVRRAIETLSKRGITRVCLGVSWCDWHCFPRGGRAWIRWYLHEFAQHFKVLPRITFTPPPLTANQGTINSPPTRLAAYAEFVHEFLVEFGDLCEEFVELWNEWNLDTDWKRDEDPDLAKFASMVAMGALVAHHHGKRVLLGGMAGITKQSIAGLAELARRGLLEYVDAVGFHDLRGTWGDQTPSAQIPQQVSYVRGTLRTPPLGMSSASPALASILREQYRAERGALRAPKQIWLTEYGFPVVDPERRFEQAYLERIQVALFAYATYSVLAGDVERVYWYTFQDFVGESVRKHTTGWEDVLQYYYGDTCERGERRLLGNLLDEGGPERVLRYAAEHNLFPLVDAASLGRRKPRKYRSNIMAAE